MNTNLPTTANVLPKRWKGVYVYGFNFSKSKQILKTTTHNRLYKIVRWNLARHQQYRYYCYICGNNENYKLKEKRNRGQKPKSKRKPWAKRR